MISNVFHFSTAILLTAALVGCQNDQRSSDDNPSPGTESTTLVLVNGKIYTVDQANPWAEAVVIKDGIITYVGTSAEARQRHDGTAKVIDLEGRMALPGLHDVHMHPLEAGSEYVACTLEETGTLDEWQTQIRQCHQQTAGTGWLLGWGHTLDTLTESNTSPRALLDAISTTRPIVIMEATSHSVWVNSKALSLAGIGADTPHPVGGAILKDREGKPNGILLDAAGDQVFDLAYQAAPDLRDDNYNALLYGLEQAASNGITSLVDARVYWKRGHLDAWQRAEKEESLTARVTLSLWAYPAMDDTMQLAALKAMYRDDTNSLLRINQVKLYSDGILHNRTAALNEPYLDYVDEVGPYGLNYFSKERLTQYTTELERTGFSMHIHAIGDRGVKESLDAIETARSVNGDMDQRHRLTHVELVADDDKSRFAGLNVTADFQLAGDFTHPENFHWVEPLIGERAYGMLPVRDIYDSGANVTLSSDWDVSTLSPFTGMQNALSRGAQSLPSLDAVIRAYTINGAQVMRQESYAGSIETGKWGDITVIDRNLFELPVSEIGNTKVDLTILGGEIVYERSAANNSAGRNDQ